MVKAVICIEGNIGVGKSTFSRLINEYIKSSEIVNEPIEEWFKMIDTHSNKNILQLFYDDKHRWSYTFQNMAYLTRMMKIENVLRTTQQDYIFLDRSLNTDRNVFEKLLYDTGYISDLEHTIYKQWYNFYNDYVKSNTIEKTIYLKASPLSCYERIKFRGRHEENNISMDYLQQLHQYHEQWLNNADNVLTINCDQDFEHNIDYQQYIIEQTSKFILDNK